jgi:hypothetical protein
MPGQFKGIRGQAQEYISSLIKEGLTNAQIVGILQNYGMTYRLSNMYSDVNRLRLEQFGAEGIKGLNVYTPVPTNLMREWQGETDYRYRVIVQYKYQSSETGEIGEKATTLYYDKPPTISDVLDDWGLRVKTIEGGYGSPQDVERIEEIKEINYFYNVPKRS